MNRDEITANAARFVEKGGRFVVKRFAFTVRRVRFTTKRTAFVKNRGRFTANRDRFSVKRIAFVANRGWFTANQPAFMENRGRFMANRGQLTAKAPGGVDFVAMTVLDTPRLRLAPFRTDEAGGLHQLWMDPGVRRYLWDDQVIPPEQTAEIVEKSQDLFDRHGYGLWSLRGRETGELVGFAGYWHFRDPPELELIFGLAPSVWGQGLAAEASRALFRYAFEDLGFSEVRASTDAANQASLRVLEKLGMRCERRATVHGLDTVFYSLQKEEWRQRG